MYNTRAVRRLDGHVYAVSLSRGDGYLCGARVTYDAEAESFAVSIFFATNTPSRPQLRLQCPATSTSSYLGSNAMGGQVRVTRVGREEVAVDWPRRSASDVDAMYPALLTIPVARGAAPAFRPYIRVILLVRPAIGEDAVVLAQHVRFRAPTFDDPTEETTAVALVHAASVHLVAYDIRTGAVLAQSWLGAL